MSMPHSLPHTGVSVKAIPVPGIPPRALLWANLSGLMQERWGRENQMELARVSGVGQATISRIRAGETSIGLDIVGKLAAVFGLEAWQILAPGWEHPWCRTPLALDVARMFDALPEAERKPAYAIIVQLLEMRHGHGSTPEPSAQPKRERAHSR